MIKKNKLKFLYIKKDREKLKIIRNNNLVICLFLVWVNAII